MTTPESPLALQLAARVEKIDPPKTVDICRASVLATIALLDDERSAPGGEWHDAVEAWNGARIRKIVRRGRGAAWTRAQEPAGVTVTVDGAEVRAFVPGPLADAPGPLAKLQIQSSDLDTPSQIDVIPSANALMIAVTPHVEMSWGKLAAQCAHAGQRAWMTADPSLVARWDKAGRPVHVFHPSPELWPTLTENADVAIHDGGYTEIPAGTLTTVAYWEEPFDKGPFMSEPNDRHDILLGGPNEQAMGLARAVRVGNHIAVGGTAAINEDGTNVDPRDIEAQVRRCYEIIGQALAAAGAGPGDVVRTRTMLTNIDHYERALAARKDFLGGTRAAETIVQVSRFVDPAWQIEIEVDAIISD